MNAWDNPIAPRASNQDLTLWSGSSAKRGRYDYDSKNHRMSDILNDSYFGDLASILRPGDYIHVTDCEDMVVVVRVDIVDRRKVFLSKIERLYAVPVVEKKAELPDDPGLAYRYRTPRAGGHSVMTSDGAVFAINFETRTDAERCIMNCYEEKVFEVPANHEPVEPYVSKNTKVYQPRV